MLPSFAAFAAAGAPFAGNRLPAVRALRNLTVRGTQFMTTRIALQVNAAVGLASAVAAGALMSVLWTRPQTVLSAVAERDYGALAAVLATQVAGWFHAVWRFL